MIQLYPDWYLIFCVIVVIVLGIWIAVLTWRER